jgi:hypothetical protein
MKMKTLAILVCLITLLSACAPVSLQANPTQAPAPTSAQPAATDANGYPAPAVPPAAQTTAYPVAGAGPSGPSDYPAPATRIPEKQPPAEEIVPIKFNLPISSGATTITGTGPKDLPIILVDITFEGAVLGNATIQADHTFKIEVKALEKGHRIGVTIDELKGTAWEGYDFSNPNLFGTTPQLVPQQNFYYDTVMIQDK